MSYNNLMADIYIFADETGDLGKNLIDSPKYFGFGSAVFEDLNKLDWRSSFQLRCELENKGLHLRSGFHANNDHRHTRSQVYSLIGEQKIRFDFSFIDKFRLIDSDMNDLQIYRYLWKSHFSRIIEEVSNAEDRIFAISASFGPRYKNKGVRGTLQELASQLSNRKIIPIYWDSASSWGLQVADYGLWAAQRHLYEIRTNWWDEIVEPKTKSFEIN